MADKLEAKRLIARDPDDLQIISALLQDGALTQNDMGFDQTSGRFAFMINRFIWEERSWFRRPKGWRRRTALHFEHVSHVKTQGLDRPSAKDALSLLSIEVSQKNEETLINLIFSDHISVQITADSLDAVMTDMGEPWEALDRPEHQ